MDNTQVKQDIDNVNINIETPSDDSDVDLQELERDNWGRILNNKTFKVMKENFRLIKKSFNNFISNVANEINTLVNKTNTIENNVNTIQTTVNELKANGGKINESTLSTLANKETVNTFKEVNTFEKGIDSTLYKLNTNELANMQGETITIGDITKSINIIGKDTTLLYNGMEIKEIAPQPDLTPYVPFTKGFRNQNSTDWFVRTNGRVTWVGDAIDMYNGDTNQFMGAFHTNGFRAYYKVPNRNGGNWNEIMDNHDLNNLNATVNQIVGSYVRDLRLSGYVVGTIYHHNIGIERNGYVVTGVVQNNNDSIVDLIQMRALQMNRGGNWYNVPFA